MKKTSQEIKKPAKVQTIKDQSKEKDTRTRQALKAPIESLGKLKLAESTSCSQKTTELKITFSPVITLPDDIEDIDAADKNSPLLMSIYIKDIYKYLTDLEELYPIEPDHLKKQVSIILFSLFE